MKVKHTAAGLALLALPALVPVVASASTAPPGTEGGGGDCEQVDDTSVQLQWLAQTQFAGYYAAADQGFYADHCLNVEIVELSDPTMVPQTQVAEGNTDFAVAWVSKALQTREGGANIVNIAQFFGRSGTYQISFADSEIASPEDLPGTTVGNWGVGNEYELLAAMAQAGVDPATDVTWATQAFDMVAFVNGDLDSAQAMVYNEYAQVLETINPDTGELFQPEDLNVMDFNELGVAMLQDALWADGDRLADDEAYRDMAVRFVAATIEGWAYCRENPEACADIVTAAGSQLPVVHQLWQMNEINKLIWPAPDGIGMMNADDWARTVELSLNTPDQNGTTILTAEPTEGAYVTDIVTEAYELLDDVDINGEEFTPIEVTLTEGGA